MHTPGWPGRFELLGCQETKTAGPASALANNDPADANYRFHGALIARLSIAVKAGCVPQVTDFHRIAAILRYPG